MGSEMRKGWRLRVCVMTALCLALAGGIAGSEEMQTQPAPDVRYVVIHHPGPNWKKGVDVREQPGIIDHVKHYRKLREQGKLEMGGPFLATDMGGMMIPAAGVTEEEIRAFAAEDPAVKAGLLEFEVRAWYVAMKK